MSHARYAMWATFWVAGLVSIVISQQQAAAAPITFRYEVTGAFTGTLDGSAFSTSRFEVTATADTDNRQVSAGPLFKTDHDSATIEIDGVGTLQFVSGTTSFVNNDSGPSEIFFSGPADLISTSSLPLIWDQLTSTGPHENIGGIVNNWDNQNILTDGGRLVFDDNFGATVEFQATIVPEPGTAVLLGIGLGGVVCSCRRFKPAVAKGELV